MSDGDHNSLLRFNLVVQDVFGLGKLGSSPAVEKILDSFRQALIDPIGLYLSTRLNGKTKRAELKDWNELLKLIKDDLDPSFALRIRERLILGEIAKQVNIESAINKALEIASKTTQSNVNNVDPDFAVEWIDAVKNITNSEVRDLWAKILASAPTLKNGRVSKPALDLLRQFDYNTARMFRDYVTFLSIAGPLSYRLPANFSPFGREIAIDLLEDIGILRKYEAASGRISFGTMGILRQIPRENSSSKFGMISSLAIWEVRPRALELAKILFDLDELAKEVNDSVASEILYQNILRLVQDEYLDSEFIFTERESYTYRIIGKAPLNTDEKTAFVDSNEDEKLKTINQQIDFYPPMKAAFVRLLKEGRLQVQPK